MKKQRKTLAGQLRSQFYHKNRWAFGVAVVSSLIGGTLNLILTWIVQQLIDSVSGAAGALTLGTLAKITGGFLILCTASFLLDYVSIPVFTRRAMGQYKDFAFGKLVEKSISSFRDESTALYLSALTNDAASIEANYLSQQLSLITKSVTFVGALALMLWYSPLMTVIAVAITALPFAASLLTGNRLAEAEKTVSEQNKDFTAALTDCLSGFTVVKAFQAEKEIYRLFARQNRQLEDKKFTRNRIKTIIGMIGAMAGICAQLGVFLVGALLAATGYAITAGTLLLFVNLMSFLIDPIAQLPGLLANRKAALALMEKMADALERNPAPIGKTTVNTLGRGIRFQNVSFGYGDGKEILHNVTVTLEAGKAYALVGASGSGKSTLLHLLMAGSTDYQGNILFDDTELRDISSESLYELISNIQQNVFVFNASIRDNVTMFRDFPREKIHSAICRAHLDTVTAEHGEDYLCGENGKNLSGGERQRISIARSLLKESKLLLADEVTSALDAQTAAQVTNDLLGLAGTTRIVVTHTLEASQLRRYDGILVLKNGRIVETGGFDELIGQKGYFYALYTVAQ